MQIKQTAVEKFIMPQKKRISCLFTARVRGVTGTMGTVIKRDLFLTVTNASFTFRYLSYAVRKKRVQEFAGRLFHTMGRAEPLSHK
jgi:hypothetical protein